MLKHIQLPKPLLLVALVLVLPWICLGDLKPEITSQPQSRTNILGESVLFTVSAQGDEPLAYQWFFNGCPIAGCTNGDLHLPSVQYGNAGSYTAIVTNLYGAATSSVAALTVSRTEPLAIPARPSQTGTVIAWGSTNDGAVSVPNDLTNAVAVAGGGNFSMALLSDGSVRAWGANDYQQCSVPNGLSNVVAIAAGSVFAMALRADGTVAAWGANHSGQTTVPSDLGRVVAISAGYMVAMAVEEDGKVRAWGGGSGSMIQNMTTGAVPIVSVMAGDAYALALRDDGSLVCSDGPAGFPSDLGPVAALSPYCERHRTVLLSNQTVRCWGDGGSSRTAVPPGLSNVIMVANGGEHTLALKANGDIVGWGGNSFGQLTFPTNLQDAIAVAAGHVHSLALVVEKPIIREQPHSRTNWLGSSATFAVAAGGSIPLQYQWRLDGQPIAGATGATLAVEAVNASDAGFYSVVVSNAFGIATSAEATLHVVNVSAWGDNSQEQCNVPCTLSNAVAIAGGGVYSLALRADGTVLGWGGKTLNQLAGLEGVSNAVAIAAEELSSLVLLSDGSVRSCGNNGTGIVFPPEPDGVTAIAAGERHGLALRASGKVEAWGYNGEGQASVPSGLGNVVGIAAGAWHSLALKADGSLMGWGLNDYGATTIPQEASNVVQVAAGAQHSVALRGDGTVVAWGLSTSGQTAVPPTLNNVVAIAAGTYHTLALRRDGSLVAWGGAGLDLVPAGLSDVVAINGRGLHVLALLGNGRPAITVHPRAQAWYQGQSAQLQVMAVGRGTMHYQWQHQGMLLPGATQAVLRLNQVTTADAGSYSVVVSNALGQTTSQSALVSLMQPMALSIQGSGSVTSEPASLLPPMGSLVTLTASPARWYEFLRWSDGNTNNPRVITASLTNEYRAVFTPTNAMENWTNGASGQIWEVPVGTPKVFINGDLTFGGSALYPPEESVVVSLESSLPASSIFYTLDGSEPDAGSAPYTAPFPLTASSIVRAVAYDDEFVLIRRCDPVSISLQPRFSLTAGTPGGGTVWLNPTNGPYWNESTVSVAAVASSGWIFLCWLGDVASTNPVVSIAMNRDKSIEASFGTFLTNAVSVGGGGSVSNDPPSGPYAFGSTVRLTALPQPGKYFVRWLDAGNGMSNSPLGVTVTNANQGFRALFGSLSGNNRSLTTLVNGRGNVTKTPQLANYTNGATVLLSVTPNASQVFQGWSGDASGTSNPLSVLMNGNKVITATFGTNTPSANHPPSVTITNPGDGAVFTAPANVIIQGGATDADGTIAQVRLFAGTNLLTTLTNAAFSCVWTNAPVGTNILLTAVATDNGNASSTSAPVAITVSLPPPGPPVFSLSTNQHSVIENGGSVTVTVLKNLNSLAGTVNYTTADGSAVAVVAGLGDYHAASGSLSFTDGETLKTVVIPVVNDYSFEGNQQFSFLLSLPGSGGSLSTPSGATITIVDDDPPASTNSLLETVFPSAVPAHDGQLRVNLLPVSAAGQWRLVWETAWRNSGETIGGLPSGNYEVEFKPVAGYLTPGNTTNPVVAGSLSTVTNQYALSGSLNFGSLTVKIEPVGMGGQWQLQGQSSWLNNGATLTNLVAGNHIVVFKSVLDWVTPAPRVVWVGADQDNAIAVTYLVGETSSGTPPSVLQFADATSPAFGLPYAYNGQLWSEAGYGSGAVVKRRVVLTAGHLVFNDATLSYVPGVKWFFQRQKGEYEPPAQTARGWYVFSGYAAARTNDASPGVSSPASQNLDVAALYFLEDAGRGGQSGYLVSEPGGTEWLQASALKMLVGYPVETVSELNRGRMHATTPGNISFALVTNRVFSTTAIRSYPGNSGGPLCVQYTNGTYYPAAVYLGGSGQTIVRAIDGAVADLINRADVTANTGDNNTGGGVVLLASGVGTLFAPGYLQVVLGPPEAVAAGAGWRIAQLTNATYYSDNTATYALPAASYTLVFRTNVAGWQSPANRALQLAANQTTVVTGNYTRAGAVAVAPTVSNGAVQLTFTAPVGQRYALERSTNLSHWQVVATNPVPADGVLRFGDPIQTSNRAAFYRARLVP